MNLDENELKRLRSIQNNGANSVVFNDPSVDPLDTDPEDVPDRRGLSLGMCNAIREAAHDGHTYSYIAKLFSFAAGRTTVHKHAQGECEHEYSDESVPPINQRKQYGVIGRFECSDLRRRFRLGVYGSFQDAADEYGVSLYAIRNHVQGECSHSDTPAVSPPQYSPNKIRKKREELGLTQRELAEKVGVSRSYVSEWENGHKRPGFSSRVFLQRVFR